MVCVMVAILSGGGGGGGGGGVSGPSHIRRLVY